ncbi:CMP/dCMP deaminase, zinc-binding protein [Ophiocordyceps camponoti-floridani]|uniref:CMP/dCMP deaminase, zinc-binding protein n=1 Tax=Ophiocordyceps camponoti-floridani TaxID=2030778 RepID=A0A8H4Q7D7_9HYPO|nr:CMP/dCMP deaminase, zinc-binding protein [Ophiocordyceps camponoti-floridani]
MSDSSSTHSSRPLSKRQKRKNKALRNNNRNIKAMADKENVPPVEVVADMLRDVSLLGKPVKKVEVDDEEEEEARVRERQQNLFFIGEALEMARLALRTNETPVGCVLVRNGSIIAKGMNATNVTRNGTRHAELMAISSLLSITAPSGPRTTSLKPPRDDEDSPDDGNEDGSKGHLYPYGQKFLPDRQVDARILRESILYVTVEPCVMCASLLRQLGIKKVYFGAVNDKFGGTGGVFSIHANSLPVSTDGQTAASHPLPRCQPSQLPDGSGTLGNSYPPGGGDGGNVEPGYEIEGGWGRDEAVGLLRRFYVQENGRAPVPRKKEGRAARLAAMMEKDDNASTLSRDGREADAALVGGFDGLGFRSDESDDEADVDGKDGYLQLVEGNCR